LRQIEEIPTNAGANRINPAQFPPAALSRLFPVFFEVILPFGDGLPDNGIWKSSDQSAYSQARGSGRFMRSMSEFLHPAGSPPLAGKCFPPARPPLNSNDDCKE
jgi:hypothetical protein